MEHLILAAATVICGAADALGFVHASRIWQGGQFQVRDALLSAAFFQLGVFMYWIALRTLGDWGVVSTEAQTLVWFVTTIIGVAILSGQFMRWQAVDQCIAIVVMLGMAWLLSRTGAEA